MKQGAGDLLQRGLQRFLTMPFRWRIGAMVRRRPHNQMFQIVLTLVLFVCLAAPALVTADEVNARAAVVIDGTSGRILFAKNPHLRLQAASTTKLVTAMVTLDRLGPDTIVTVSHTAANTPSVTPHLRPGEQLSVRDLMMLALMRSINGATVALAEAVAGSEEAFVLLMNGKMRQIGADNTVFINASGLPGAGQHITAYELAKIMKESLSYSLIREIINTRTARVTTLQGRRILVKSTNHLLWTDDDLLGGKTGYTKAARHCFVCAADKGNTTLIAAVLGEASRGQLWEDASMLLARGSDVLALRVEPAVHITGLNDQVLVPAAYAVVPRKASGQGKATVAKSHRKAKEGQTVKIAKKSVKKRKGAAVAQAEDKRTRKSLSRNLSAQVQGSGRG